MGSWSRLSETVHRVSNSLLAFSLEHWLNHLLSSDGGPELRKSSGGKACSWEDNYKTEEKRDRGCIKKQNQDLRPVGTLLVNLRNWAGAVL